MSARIYPSNQDTSTTAIGSLILSMDPNIEFVDIYVNNLLQYKNYLAVQGLYSLKINVGDVVRFENINGISVNLSKIDYTTDDVNGNNGIVETYITGITNTTAYTFTATTIQADYNFEYIASIGVGSGPLGYKGTLLLTYKTSVDQNLNTANFIANYFWAYGTYLPDTNFFLTGTSIQFSGTTSQTQNLGYFPLSGATDNHIPAALTTQICYTSLSSGLPVQGIPDCYFKVYVNNVLQSTATYTAISNGFGIVNNCSSVPPLSQTFVQGNFVCNDGDIVEYVFEDNFTIINDTPTPTPTPIVPTPTPTATPSPTPTITPTPTPVPDEGKYMLAVQGNNLVYRTNNYGSSWTQVTGFTTGMTVTNTAISRTGQYQVVSVYNGAVYVSNDYGVSFSAKTSNDTWIDCDISSDGQYINAITDTLATRKLIWSTNYGSTFPNTFSLIGQSSTNCGIDGIGNSYISFRNGIQKYTLASSTMSTLYSNANINWSGIAVSDDGTKIATARNATVAYSLNGSTFSTVGSANTLISYVTASRNGQYVGTYSLSNIYNSYSNNYAVNWNGPIDFGYPAYSYSGLYQCLALGDNVKLSSNYGTSFSTIYTSSGANWKNITMNK